MVLDYLFIAVLDLGIGGAAVATGLGYSVTAVVGLFVFRRRESLLHFTKPVFRLRVLANAATNGCSEMATALVTGIVTMMFNWTMLRYVGEEGIAAVTIIMYVLMFATACQFHDIRNGRRGEGNVLPFFPEQGGGYARFGGSDVYGK